MRIEIKLALATLACCWPTACGERTRDVQVKNGQQEVRTHEQEGRGHEREDGDEDDAERDRIRIGLKIAPVTLNLEGLDKQLVGLGSYLVNAAGNCNSCHTNPSWAPGHNPFCGEPKQVNAENYLAGGMRFGPFTSRNLTPEDGGNPAGLTFSEFLKVMRTGIDLDQEHPQISPLLQVMPWPVYQDFSDHDIRAIYEFLRAIPPATPGSGSSACP